MMGTSKIKSFHYFIGIDVSKYKLDVAVMRENVFLIHKEIHNEPRAIADLVNELKTFPKFSMKRALFCMESTGLYCNPSLQTLSKLNGNIVRENPLQILNSLGTARGKYDKIDAIRIANYAYKNQHELILYKERRPVLEQLAHLSALRKRLVTLGKGIKTTNNEQRAFLSDKLHLSLAKLYERTLNAIEADLGGVDKLIREVIESDDRICRLDELIQSVTSVGPVTSLQIIVTTNEFYNYNDPKKFASFAGVAPFRNESGTSKKRTATSPIANKEIKSLLHLCSLSAIRLDRGMKQYYLKKTKDEGKAKLSVLNAIRFKIISRIFACVHQDRCYEKDYARTVKSITPMIQ